MGTSREPVDVRELLPAEAQAGGVLADAEIDAAIAAVLRLWLVEDDA
ncbi:MAG: hypothetical protein ACXVWW_10995 [Nocardioides sp.]